MKLSISNIGWDTAHDNEIYGLMQKYQFSGLEIAPTRIFEQQPYSCLEDAKEWSKSILQRYGLAVSSMQSIWYGRQESIFGTEQEVSELVDYTKKAIDFAKAIKCGNLVFGCPRNRNVPEGVDSQVAISFFKEIGGYAAKQGTVIGMEANPPIYNTNYVNDTVSALELIEQVDSQGFKLNLDVGTMICNDEDVKCLKGRVDVINHVHISEPGLKPIENRQLHKELRKVLSEENYSGYVSIEMGKGCSVEEIEEKMIYLRDVFG